MLLEKKIVKLNSGSCQQKPQRVVFVATTIILAVGLASCAGLPTPAPVAISNTSDPTSEIKLLEQELSDGIARQVDVLAPRSYESANLALAQAKELREKNAPSAKILEKVGQGKAWSASAFEKAKVFLTAAGDVAEARNQARLAHAGDFFPRDLRSIDDDLINVSASAEKGDLKSLEKQKNILRSRYATLEAKTVAASVVGEPEKTLETAVKEGAEKSTPKSLAAARVKLAAAKAEVLSNPRNGARNAALASELKNDTDHVLKLTRDAKRLAGQNIEDIALAAEDSQKQYSDLANQKQASDEAVRKKSEEIKKTEDSLKLEQAATQSLLAKQAQLDRIKSIRKRFSSDEAEVYQDGNAILLRLKGLNFASNGSTIEPKYFPLLKRIEEVVAEFSEPRPAGMDATVIVEGHTDSIGAPDLNKALSVRRAEAVRDYLVAQKSALGPKVQTAGYGFEKPLASNKSPEGRAQNRRIDIVISPN